MTRRFFYNSLAGLMALLYLLAFSILALAAEFSADLIQKKGDQLTKGKIYIKGKKIRMETEEGPISIMDLESGKGYLLQPEKTTYMEMPSTATIGEMGQSEEELAKIADKKHVGTEKLNGYECDKYQITYKDKTMGKMIQWYSKKLDYPIKIVHYGPHGEMMTEYKNIKEHAISDSFFKIPTGYKKTTWW